MAEENTTARTTPDLDKARDEKCIPIARGILSDMVTDLIPENVQEKIAGHSTLVKKILERGLAANLNITSEASYLFQLILSIFSGFNTTIQTCTTEPLDEVRYNRIAKAILSLMATEDLPMDGIKKENFDSVYLPVKEKLNALFLAEKVTRLEARYIMDSLLQGFTSANNLFSQSLEASSARAEAKLFGIDSMSDLTLGRLNEILTMTPSPYAGTGADKNEEQK